MSTTRTNTAQWMENQRRWQIKVQKDGVRKTFTSSTAGRTGQRKANAKADLWLTDGVTTGKDGITPVSLYELRHTFVSIVKSLPEGQVKSIVGHSQDMDTFGIYGHELLGEDAQLAKDVGKVFDKLLNPLKK